MSLYSEGTSPHLRDWIIYSSELITESYNVVSGGQTETPDGVGLQYLLARLQLGEEYNAMRELQE